MVPLLLLVPLGPLLSWKRADLYPALQRLYWVAGAALLSVILVLAFTSDQPVLAALGIGLAVWVMVGSFAEIWSRSGFSKVGFAIGFSRLRGLPRTMWSTAFGHFGLGVIMLGIVAVTAFEKESVAELASGETISIAGYDLQLTGLVPVTGPNYSETVAALKVSTGGAELYTLRPSKRFYQARGMPTTEAAIRTTGFSQLYVSLGDISQDGKAVVRVWWKPQITLIWLGTIFMVLAGMISLSDRRLRVGVAKPAKARSSINEGEHVSA
jgi:cytochrome c-type biogenesis protein CcmF